MGTADAAPSPAAGRPKRFIALMGQLAHLLRQVIDHLTPHGELPAGDAGGDLGSQLGGLLSGFLKR